MKYYYIEKEGSFDRVIPEDELAQYPQALYEHYNIPTITFKAVVKLLYKLTFKRQKRNIATQKAYALRCKKELVRKATEPEKYLCEMLEEEGISFEFQREFYDEYHVYIVDFLIHCKGGNIVVELDGAYHKKKKAHDRKRTLWLKSIGITKVRRFTNKQLYAYPENVIDRIMEENPKIITKL